MSATTRKYLNDVEYVHLLCAQQKAVTLPFKGWLSYMRYNHSYSVVLRMARFMQIKLNSGKLTGRGGEFYDAMKAAGKLEVSGAEFHSRRRQ